MEAVSRSDGSLTEASTRGPAPSVPGTQVLAVGECPCARWQVREGHGSPVQHSKSRSLTRTFFQGYFKNKSILKCLLVPSILLSYIVVLDT